MKTILLQDWKFWRGDADGAFCPGYDDTAWLDVVVPHDWSVKEPFSREHSSGTGYLPGGVGWYRTYFSLEDCEIGSLNFEGVYKNAQVWINGNYLGRRPNGYIGFRYDVSSFLKRDNIVAVKVIHTDIADSRWFTGSGIYRNVTLTAYNGAYIPAESVFFTFDGENARIRANVIGKADFPVAVSFGEHRFEAGGNEIDLHVRVEQPKLWSVDSPYLYDLTFSGSDGLLCKPIRVGLRTFRFDPGTGFSLNGVSMKIKGVCLHHDAGCLGAAVYPSVWRDRLTKLKDAGCNAIRTSHNPHMPQLYDLCDELGLLMMDEAFDEWEGCKNKWIQGHNVYPPAHQGYAEDFPEWHERDLTDLILRDRNHPSVVMWSVGNEIDYPNDPYVHPLFQKMTGNNDSGKPAWEMVYSERKPSAQRLPVIAKRLVEIVRRHDGTRPVLTASAFPELSSQIGFFKPFDIIGYNYKESLYEADHMRFPDLPIIGSENDHSYRAWTAVRDTPYIAAQFLWTGADFLGEARGWPVRGSACGLLDAAGFEKDAYYRRKAMWSNEPFLYISNSWNSVGGETVEVVCYTNADSVELFLNGKSLGVRQRSEERVTWRVAFERGELKAVGSNGAAAAVASRLPSVKLALTPRGTEKVGAYTFSRVEVKALDDDGVLCDDCCERITYEVSGGSLLGIENGDLRDLTEYSAPDRRLYYGRSVAYVLTKGRAILTAKSERFQEKTCWI
ncbi:MAG: glycoside hydrolase family 2 protein [Clostridium sp.]|jgi:hypothetical protein|nr:glycoside hydrolase family 2 protein [Clostridium sp.]